MGGRHGGGLSVMPPLLGLELVVHALTRTDCMMELVPPPLQRCNHSRGTPCSGEVFSSGSADMGDDLSRKRV